MPPRGKLDNHIATEADVRDAGQGKRKVLGYPGLYLYVSPKGVRRYLYRYTVPRQRKVTETSVGKPGIPLTKAKEVADRYAGWLRDGIDPQEMKQQNAKETATFGQVADDWIDLNKAGNGESWLAQAKRHLKVHSEPLRKLLIAKVSSDPTLVRNALAELFEQKPKEGRRVLNTISHVFNFAKASKYPIASDNPADWKKTQKHLFPRQGKTIRKHHPSMPYQEIPAFLQELRQRRGTAAIALEFCILTATRTSETLEAEWSEFDLENKTWVIPAKRMGKTGEQHRVPLSDRAIELLKFQKPRSPKFVFTGYLRHQALAEKSMLMLLRAMGITKEKADVHGFRHSFRNFCAERKYDFVASEMALSHKVGNQVTQAYLTTDMLNERRDIMAEWAKFCG